MSEEHWFHFGLMEGTQQQVKYRRQQSALQCPEAQAEDGDSNSSGADPDEETPNCQEYADIEEDNTHNLVSGDVHESGSRQRYHHVTFMVYVPRRYNPSEIRKLSCNIYSAEPTGRFSKSVKFILKPSQLCRYIWESRPVKCKIKKQKFRYKVNLKGSYCREEKDSSHDLHAEASEHFDMFTHSKESVDIVDEIIYIILHQIMLINEKRMNTAAKACFLCYKYMEKLPQDDFGKVAAILQEVLKSPNLSLQQCVAVVIVLGYIKDRETYQTFMESLSIPGEDSDHGVVDALKGFGLLVNAVGILRNCKQLDYMNKCIICCALKGKVAFLTNAYDQQIAACVMDCSSMQQLNDCLDLMYHVHQNRDIKTLQSSVKALQKRTVELLKRNPTHSHEKSELTFIKKVLDDTYHCRPFFTEFLECLVTSRNIDLWKFSKCAINNPDLVGHIVNKQELCDKWMNNAIRFRNERNHLVVTYESLEFIIGTHLVKHEQSLEEHCKKYVKAYVEKYDLCDMFGAATQIKTGGKHFLDHMNEIVAKKAKRNLQNGKPLFINIKPVLVENARGVMCVKVDESIILVMLNLLIDVAVTDLNSNCTVARKLEALVRERRFWRSLFQATGKNSVGLNDLQAMKDVLRFCKATSDAIINRTILTKEALEMNGLDSEKVPGVLDILAQGTVASRSGESGIDKYKKKLKESWKAMCDELKNFNKMCTDTKYLVVFIHSFKNLKLEHNKSQDLELLDSLEVKAGNSMLCDVVNGSFWRMHNLDEIQRLANEHKDLLNFISFRNFVFRQILLSQDAIVKECLNVNVFAKTIFGEWKKNFGIFIHDHIIKGEDADISSISEIFQDTQDVDRELDELARYFRNPCCETVRKAFVFWSNRSKLKEKGMEVIQMMKLCKVDCFDLESDVKKLNMYIEGKIVPECENTILKFYHNLVDTLHELSNVNTDSSNLISALVSSNILVPLLKELLDENLSDLMNAVEEHAEDFVNSPTVLSLMQVKTFLQPILEDISSEKLSEWKMIVGALCNALRNEKNPTELVKKVDLCARSASALKSLRNNVRGRKLVTKEFVKHVIETGKIKIISTSTKTVITLTTIEHEEKVETSLDGLNEVRSRVLLLSNKRSTNDANQKQFEVFVSIIDRLNEIHDLLEEIHLSGMIHLQHIEKYIEDPSNLLSEIETCQHDWNEELLKWTSNLKFIRQKYFYLNFIFGEQFRQLYCLLETKECCSTTESILQYIFPNVNMSEIDFCLKKVTVEDPLESIAQFLNMLSQSQKERFGYACNEPLTIKSPLFVRMNHKVESVVPVILQIYEKEIPTVSSILICQSDTSLEEVQLFIQRCYRPENSMMYCLVNIHVLDTICQHEVFSLIESKELLNCGSRGQLVIIYRGTANFILGEENQGNIQEYYGLSRIEQKEVLSDKYPHISTVTSDTTGLGKTEHICHLAGANGLSVETLTISGHVNRIALTEKILEYKDMESKLLHINIKDVDDKSTLDNFLFELLVLKCVSAGPLRAYLSPGKIAIEIENTLCNELQDQLPTMTCFQITHLKWQAFSDFIVSDETHSSTQTVLQYMQLYENRTINHMNVILGDQNLRPLTKEEAIHLLTTYCKEVFPKNFSTITAFLQIFGEQLKQLSRSEIFRVPNINFVLGPEFAATIRSELFERMLCVSVDFVGNNMPQNTIIHEKSVDECMVERASQMKKWEEDNHFIAIFNSQDSNVLTPLYRNIDEVPKEIKKMFEIHTYKPLSDIEKCTQDEMKQKVEMIACQLGETRTDIDERLEDLATSYSLTADNVLKMALILLRIRSRIPVILMGETGCGKTTLVKYLALTSGSEFEVINLHAGISEDQLKNRLDEVRHKATSTLKEMWVFFDEINTCDHLGILNEALCHRLCFGEHVEDNIVFIAACNPYKMRNKDQIMTSGLQKKNTNHDPKSHLVYRVHPLPEAMTDFVWDYGSLKEKDEQSYVEKMLHPNTFNPTLHVILPKLVDLVMASHNFLRNEQNVSYCVSLRDVSRFRCLIIWFHNMLIEKLKHKSKFYTELKPGTKAFVFKIAALALSQCYGSALSNSHKKEAYWREMANIFYERPESDDWNKLTRYVDSEQSDILNRMDIQANVAKTACLKENVFSLFCCLMNRIPVFLLGKPGCSKSLSVQLLKSSLRGKDSKDPYFKTLPQLFVVSYQSSGVATSDEIEKVFSVAKQYTDDKTILPVVLLDEIGLAETSPYNPLKALHSLLDTNGQQSLDIAVIGISNWALDAAKMNRAIHVSVPDLNFEDLLEAAKCLNENKTEEKFVTPLRDYEEKILGSIAKTFIEYQQKDQRFPDFHGARDFYGLIKYVTSKAGKVQHFPELIERFKHIVLNGVQRNLGGISVNETEAFMMRLGIPEGYQRKSIGDLIMENISDSNSRHLMVIYEDESMVEFLLDSIHKNAHDYEVLVGSHFENDYCDSYIYMVLSKIIACMEKGIKLILKDLDGVYGSLYDMLNQSYTRVGMSKRCRISLGANCNSACEVHDDFKCIVLVKKTDLPVSDPPFLNRFEKQFLHHNSFMTAQEIQISNTVDKWVQNAADILTEQFSVPYAFPGYNKEIVRSLVSMVCENQKSNLTSDDDEDEVILSKCQKLLLQTMPPDAVLRLSASRLASFSETEVRNVQTEYFKETITVNGFKNFFCHILDHYDKGLIPCETGLQVVVYTHSSIFVNVAKHITGLFSGAISSFRMNEFKSEKQLSMAFDNFVAEDNDSLLLLQIRASCETQHISLAKYLLKQSLKQLHTPHKKHICFILHLDKVCDYKEEGWRFSYFDKWNIFTIDRLDGSVEKCDVLDILSSETTELLQKKEFHDIEDSIKRNLEWAFCCLNYTSASQKLQPYTKEQLESLSHLELVISFLSKKIVQVLSKEEPNEGDVFDKKNWQVALTISARGILQGIPLFTIWKNHLEKQVQKILTHIVYQVELESAWFCLLTKNKDVALQQTWADFAEDLMHITLAELATKIGPKALDVSQPILHFRIPFSRTLIKDLQPVLLEIKHDLIHFETESSTQIDENESGESDLDTENILVKKYLPIVNRCLADKKLGNYVKRHIQTFVDDFYTDLTSTHYYMIQESRRVEICNQLIHSEIVNNLPEEILTQAIVAYMMNEETIKIVISMVQQSQEFSTKPNHWLVDENSKEESRDIETFIYNACEAILPSKLNESDRLVTRTNVENWLEQTATFLSYVNKANYDVFLAELLKVFHDLIDSVYLPYNLHARCQGDLITLEGKAVEVNKDKENIFSSTDFLEAVTSVYRNLKNGDKMLDTGYRCSLNKFMCLYFERCIANSTDNPCIWKMLLCMKEMGQVDESKFVGAVIHLIIAESEESLFQILTDVIEERPVDLDAEAPYIGALNHYLTLDKDESWNVLVCDVLQKETFSNINMEEEHWFDRFIKASSMISTRKLKPLVFFILTAYVKACLSLIGNCLQVQNRLKFTNTMESLNRRLKDSKVENAGFYIYFLQSLKGFGIQSLKENCCRLREDITFLDTLKWSTAVIGINPFVVNNPVWDDQKALKMMEKKLFRIEEVVEIIEFIGYKYYLARFDRINDTVEQSDIYSQTKQFVQHIPIDMNMTTRAEECKQMLMKLGNCMLGCSSFGTSLMDATEGIQPKYMSVGIFIVRVAQLLLTSLSQEPGQFVNCIMRPYNENENNFTTLKKHKPKQELQLSLKESSKFLQLLLDEKCCCHGKKSVHDMEKAIHEDILYQESLANIFVEHFLRMVWLSAVYCGKLLMKRQTIQKEESALLESWNAMQGMSGCNASSFEVLMHILLNETKDIFASIKREYILSHLDEIILPIMKEKDRYIMNYKIKMHKNLNIAEDAVEQLVEETCDSHAKIVGCIYRSTELPSIRSLKSSVIFSKGYTLLKILTSMESHVMLLSHLPNIINWIRIAHQSTQKVMTRQEAQNSSVDGLLKQKKKSKKTEELNAVFKQFVESWYCLVEPDNLEILKPMLTDLAGNSLTSLGHFHRVYGQNKFYDCVIPKKDFADNKIYMMIQALLRIQNTFLANVLQLCHENTTVKKVLISAIKCMQLHETQKHHIVCFEWNSDLLNYSQNSTRYGNGSQIYYDLQTIESDIAISLLSGKPILQIDTNKFPFLVFRDDVYHPCGELLHGQLKFNCLQEKLPDDHYIEDQALDIIKQEEAFDVLTRVITVLEILLVSLNEATIKPDPQELVLSYLKTNFSKSIVMQDTIKVFSQLKDLKLCHLVSFYEYLEEQLAKQWESSLEIGSEYNCKFENVQREELCVFLERKYLTNQGDLTVEQILKTFQKALVRHVAPCLYQDNAESTNNLGELLEDPYIWYGHSYIGEIGQGMDWNENVLPKILDNLPKSLAVKHVIESIKFIRQYDQEQKNYGAAPSKLAKEDIMSKSVPGTAHGKKKKKWRQF